MALSSPQLQVAPRIPEVRPFVNTLGLAHPVAQQIPYFAFTLAEYRRYPEPYQKDNKWERGRKSPQMLHQFSPFCEPSQGIKEPFPKLYFALRLQL